MEVAPQLDLWQTKKEGEGGGWGNPTCKGGGEATPSPLVGGAIHPCPLLVRVWPFALCSVRVWVGSIGEGPRPHWLRTHPHPHWVEGVGGLPHPPIGEGGGIASLPPPQVGLPHPSKEVMVGWPPTHLCSPLFPFLFSFHFLFLSFLCHKSISVKTLMAGTQKEQIDNIVYLKD